jgi:two-component system phosphate regulon response regulator PhoB
MRRTILIASGDAATLVEAREPLEAAGFDVSEADQGELAISAARKARPALVLLDLALVEPSGTEVLRRLRRNRGTAELPVILLSDRGEEIDRVIGFELGADDFVAKPFSARELALRVQAVLRRAAVDGATDGEHLVFGRLRIDVPRHQVFIEGKLAELTALEFRLLLDLASRRGHVQRRDELLDRVWRYPTSLETRTVDTHVKRLREKLGAAGYLIETVRGVGYRFRYDD